MERKQGFFTALKDEVVRGLSPGRSRTKSPARSASPMSSLLRRRKSHHVAQPDPLISRSGSLRPPEALSPLKEGPDGTEGGDLKMEGSLQEVRSEVVAGVLGAPLAPVHVSTTDPLPHLSIKDTPIVSSSISLTMETSSAQYILQQYTAASGGQKLQNSIHNAYAMGRCIQTCGMWSLHLVAARFMLVAMGSLCGGTPHGSVHMLQKGLLDPCAVHFSKVITFIICTGLDPRTTASMFANARCIGEKKINGEDCFILKLCADPLTLKARSEGPAEIIRHVLFGYFSHKTGLLVHLEDSHLTRIQNNGGDAVYWETTINSFLDDYRPVEGIMIAHSGRSVVTLFRFGETAMSHTKTRMEEAWTIEEVAFNVPGLSMDCFIPPAELRFASMSEACDLPQGPSVKTMPTAAYRAKVAALEKSHDRNVNNIMWKMDV
ncbi:hypothetical protein FNV43_RR13229 [Rhamnella rubrinervis]|uniref:Uncharacterized protein n=1 Tax=Rhamnella rubrinervis TaxID=2594499 RepID=A0A8K0MF19_9ROSA|nr:hypothetical protein FNV43_RR13229 [Rhamnella rubrinervis]